MEKEIERQNIIKRYENIVKRWQEEDDGNMTCLFPEKYKEICLKLELLKAGVDYKIKDITLDCIEDMFVKMCSVQQYNPLDRNTKTVKDIKNIDYEFKTDLPDFVDKVIKEKLKK